MSHRYPSIHKYHLKNHVPLMYKLYKVLKDCWARGQLPTTLELEIDCMGPLQPCGSCHSSILPEHVQTSQGLCRRSECMFCVSLLFSLT
jgi:hypothetical protein